MKKPGRKPALDPRETRINLRLSSAEVQMLDSYRGGLKRPAFLRALLTQHHQRKVAETLNQKGRGR